jgi:protein involved in polysaccharide export with SLBB domain
MKPKLTALRLVHWPIAFSVFIAAVLVLLSGCETTKSKSAPSHADSVQNTNSIVLREADTLKVIFPGDSTLTTAEVIRRDGKITLPIIGEVMAAGKTPAELQSELVQLYSKQLVSSKDISVAVTSSTFPVFVNGAVRKPGKVTSDHPLTVLEAIMEAGGFEYDSAKMNAVKIIRTQDGKSENFTVNLDGVRTGKQIPNVYLQPSDIIYVPSKIKWF